MTRKLLHLGALGLALALVACGGGDEADEAEPVVNMAAVRDSVQRARGMAQAEALIDTAGLASENVLRETFEYGGGARDPFASLLDADRIGPEFADLLLLGVYRDHARPANSVALLRDRVSGKRYSMKPGDHTGRVTLLQVREREAVFAIEDFGYERQETLSLPKREVEFQ